MSRDGSQAMLHDLMRRNLSHFDITEVPQTSALLEQKLLSIKTSRLLPQHGGWHQEVMRDALYKDYVKAFGRSLVSSRAIATELGIYLARLLLPGYPRRFQRRQPPTPGEPTRRSWFWGFPLLSECRDHFNWVTHGAIIWADP